MDDQAVTACVLIIGNEILSGRTQDVNLNHIALTIGGWGIQVREARVVPDIDSAIVDAVNYARTTYDYVFTDSGTTSAGGYMPLFGGPPGSSTFGFTMPFDMTITEAVGEQTTAAITSVRIRKNGSNFGVLLINPAAQHGADLDLDLDYDAADEMQLFAQTAYGLRRAGDWAPTVPDLVILHG